MTTPTDPDLRAGQGASAVPAAASAPAKTAPAKEPDARPESKPESQPDTIPTGFPEPATPDEPREPAPDGKVRLAPQGFGSLTVPPLEEGGETVVITAEGTDVDQETAERAHEAARLAGFVLREV